MATESDPAPILEVGEDLLVHLPRLRALALRFDDARIGVGHRGLDLLRRRVFDLVRREVAARGGLEEVPETRAFAALPAAPGWNPESDEAVHVRLLRLVSERRPFPVRNDAEDAGGLLGLFHRLPSFTFDATDLRPPLRIALGRKGQTLPSPAGPRPVEGRLLVSDRGGPVACLAAGVLRGGPTEKARQLLVVLLDPGTSGGLDLRAATRRAANWMETLTGARLAASAVAP